MPPLSEPVRLLGQRPVSQQPLQESGVHELTSNFTQQVRELQTSPTCAHVVGGSSQNRVLPGSLPQPSQFDTIPTFPSSERVCFPGKLDDTQSARSTAAAIASKTLRRKENPIIANTVACKIYFTAEKPLLCNLDFRSYFRFRKLQICGTIQPRVAVFIRHPLAK